jgi:membrane protein DedA with SNARE-associated domain
MPEFLLDVIRYVDGLPLLMRAGILIISALVEYIFPVFPGDTIVIASGFFNARGNMGLWEIYISLSIGTALGIWLTFYVGKFITNKKITAAWLGKIISPEKLLKINQWYQKWGYGLLLANRFFPGIRSLFFVAAGMSNMLFWPVLVTGLVSALLFNSALLLVGYLAGYNFEIISNFWHQYTIIAYSLIGLVILVFSTIFYLKKKK